MTSITLSQHNNFGIIGHSGVLESLERQRERHAVMLLGQAGLGRRKLAYYLAVLVNCEQALETPCGQCRSCKAALNNSHPDIWEIGPKLETSSGKQARKPSISVKVIADSRDDTHEFERHVLEWLELGASFRRKVVIFDGAELLSPEAANALLKVVEEPPHHALFIFIAREMESVLPTIISRCTRVLVAPVPLATLERTFPDAPSELLEFAAGRPGILLECEVVMVALDQARTFVETLKNGMLEVLQAAEVLAKTFDARWHPQVLRFLWRDLPTLQRLAAEQHLLELTEQLEQYANSSLVFSVFTLKLRHVLGHSS